MKKLLAITGGGIGDVIRATPAFKALGGLYELDVMVSGLGYKIMKGCPRVNHVYNWNVEIIMDSLDYGKYDKIFFMEHVPWLPEWLSKIQKLPNYYDFKFSRCTTSELTKPTKNEVMVMMEIAYDLDYNGKIPELYCNYDRHIILPEFDFCFCMGGGQFVRGSPIGDGLRRRFKDWKDLADKLKGYKIALVGDNEDSFEPTGGVHDFRSSTSLVETASIIKNSKVVVTNDCGLSHMAAALGSMTFTFMGPTTPIKDAPYSNKSVIVMHKKCPYIDGDLKDKPCLTSIYQRECPKQTCMSYDLDKLVENLLEWHVEEK